MKTDLDYQTLTRTLSLGTLLLGTVLLSVSSGCGHRVPQSSTFGTPEEVAKTGTWAEATGVMSRGDYQRVASLEDKAAHGGKLSEGEVNWLLSLTRQSGTEQQTGQRLFYVIVVFADASSSSLPAARKEAVFNLATQALRYMGNPKHIPVLACFVLGKLQDKRAIPYLTAALSSSNSNVSRAARQELHVLNKLP